MRTEKSGMSKLRKHQREFIALFILPPTILYILFLVYPTLKAFYTSFFRWSGFTMNMKFIGLTNYIKIFKDDVILKALYNNIFILFWCTFFTFLLSMFFATIITRKKYRDNGFFKLVFFIPYIISVVVVSMLWMFIYEYDFGLLNNFLSGIGLESWTRLWLGDPNVIMGALTVPLVWINVGFYMVIYIAAILEIPPEQFESADIDGANELQKYLFITLPSMWQILRVSLIFFIVTAFNYSFEIIYVITRGGPYRSSEILTTYIYENAFRKNDFGYASAIGMLLFVIVSIFIIIVVKATGKKGED